jgi:CHASE2 domain-containing sensor protein
MIRGSVDLTPSQVTSAGVDGAFIALDLRLPRPAEPVHVRLAGAFNAVHVVVPPGTPVGIRADVPINVVHRASTLPAERADVPGYDVKIEGAFNRVTVEESESPSSAPEAPRPPAEAPGSPKPPAEKAPSRARP